MLFLLSAFPAKLATAKKTQIISLKLQLTWSRSLNVKDVENVQIEAGKGEIVCIQVIYGIRHTAGEVNFAV